jgi:Zn-dependent peptidase ImmA (M78 family)
LAHELSHHELRHQPEELFDSVGCRRFDPVQEAEAAWLAGCFLVSKAGALAALKRGLSIPEGAAMFGVSEDMFRFRANVTGATRIALMKGYVRRGRG